MFKQSGLRKAATPLGYVGGRPITDRREWENIYTTAMNMAIGGAKAQELSQVDLMETEDRISENQKQAERNTAFAFAQARQNRPVGGGAFRRRQNYLPPSNTLGSATAKARAEARRKQINDRYQNMTPAQRMSLLQSGLGTAR